MNLINRFFNMIFDPVKVFESIKEKPVWIMPLIFMIIFQAAAAFLFMRTEFAEDLLYEELDSKMQNVELTDEQFDNMINMSKKWAPIGPVFSLPLMNLVIAGIIYVGISVISGGAITFKSLFSLTCHIQLIAVPQAIFGYLLVWRTGSLSARANPRLFLGDMDLPMLLNSYLGWMDFFIIWEILLLGTGVAILCKWSRTKTMLTFLAVYLLFALAGAGLGTWITNFAANATGAA